MWCAVMLARVHWLHDSSRKLACPTDQIMCCFLRRRLISPLWLFTVPVGRMLHLRVRRLCLFTIHCRWAVLTYMLPLLRFLRCTFRHPFCLGCLRWHPQLACTLGLFVYHPLERDPADFLNCSAEAKHAAQR